LLRRTFENPRRFSAELFPQLAACAHDSMTGDVRHAARTRAAVARRRIGVGDDDAHLLDRHAHLLRGELAQYRVRARTLVDSRARQREAAVGALRDDYPGVAAADVAAEKRDAAAAARPLRLVPAGGVERSLKHLAEAHGRDRTSRRIDIAVAHEIFQAKFGGLDAELARDEIGVRF